MARKPVKIDYSPSDFLGGTMLLDAMEELAYRRICDLIYVMGGSVPDDKKLADLTKTKSRWPRIRKRLLDMEKIALKNGSFFVERCSRELERKRLQSEKAREGAEKTNALKNKKTNDAVAHAQRTPSVTHSERSTARPASRLAHATLNPISIESSSSYTESSSRARASPADPPQAAALQNSQSDLIQAGNRCLEAAGLDPGRYLGDFRIVAKWQSAGADLERHVLPTISAIAARPGYKPPQSLKYFDQAVTEAIAAPPVSNGADTAETYLDYDWKVPKSDVEYAQSRGLTYDQVFDEADKFYAYYTEGKGKNRKATHWDGPASLWRAWVDRGTGGHE